MFSLDQIKEANVKVKTGADFPGYVKELIQIGVVKYDTYVQDGRTKFEGQENFNIETEAKYPEVPLNELPDPEQFKHFLKLHQEGETDFPGFVSHAAATGIHKWTVDTREMTCSYYDKTGCPIHIESIPK